MKALKKLCICIGVALFWLLLWQAGAMAIGNLLIFPSPVETVIRLAELVLTADFWLFTVLSLTRIFIGIVTAIPAAIIFSALCTWSKTADRLFAPAVTLMRSVPVVSFILIAIFIFSREIIPSVITFTMAFPVLYENLRRGISCTDKELLEMSKVFAVSPIIKLKRIYFPAVKPFLFSAICTSVGLAMKAGIAAEVIAYIPNSIGKNLSDAKSYMAPADLFAWTAVILLLSLILEKAVRLILREEKK